MTQKLRIEQFHVNIKKGCHPLNLVLTNISWKVIKNYEKTEEDAETFFQ